MYSQKQMIQERQGLIGSLPAAQCGTIDKFRGSTVQIVLECLPNAYKDVGQVVDPALAFAPSSQGSLEVAVKALDHLICR